MLVFLHLGEDFVKLDFPGLLILFEDFVDPVLEEYLFERGVVPIAFKFIKLYLELTSEQFLGVGGVVFEDIVDREELRFVVYDDAGVRGDVRFAVCEGVKGVDGLVGAATCLCLSYG